MNDLTLKLASRNIMRNKRRTGLMVLLVASALVAMIITDGLIIGMTNLMISKVTDTWLGEAEVHEPGFRDDREGGHYIKDPSVAVAILEQDPGVRAYSLRTLSGGMVASSSNVTPSAVIGIDPEAEADVSRLGQALIKGEFIDGKKSNEIMIGYKMAELLEVELGDRIVVSASEDETSELSQGLYRVTGLLKFNDRSLDKQTAYISLAAGQKLSAIGTGIHEIAIRFDKEADEAEVSARLKAAFDAENLEFLTWGQLLPDLASVLEVNQFSSLIVGGILFVLVSLGLINSMFMSIYERHYEFGVMLGLGTRRRVLFSLVCWEGVLIGVLGSIFGLIGGGLLNSYLSVTGFNFGEAEMSGIMLNEPITTVVALKQFTLFPLFVIALSALACIIPALHGARLVPAIALRRTL